MHFFSLFYLLLVKELCKKFYKTTFIEINKVQLLSLSKNSITQFRLSLQKFFFLNKNLYTINLKFIV